MIFLEYNEKNFRRDVISVLAAIKRISPEICVFRNLCSSSVTFPMEFLAHILTDLLHLAGILAFGSFLYNRLSIKPQVIDGKRGGRDELRTIRTKEGQKRKENFHGLRIFVHSRVSICHGQFVQ